MRNGKVQKEEGGELKIKEGIKKGQCRVQSNDSDAKSATRWDEIWWDEMRENIKWDDQSQTRPRHASPISNNGTPR